MFISRKRFSSISSIFGATLLAGCQTLPSDLATTDVMEHARSTFSVAGVSHAQVSEYSASRIFSATYTEQYKATVTLPSAANVFGLYADHCEARDGAPTLIDRVSMVCIKNGEILYSVTAAQLERDKVAMQIVQPVIQGPIRTDPQFISDYAVRFFGEHLKSVGQPETRPLALAESDRARYGISVPPYDR